MSHKTILQTIGDTPFVALNRYSPNLQVTILAKLEGSNPSGSVKDRVALSMMLDAQKRGLLNMNKIIMEPTSGNTGIGIAMIAAILGHKFLAVMPASVSIERRKLLTAYGADLHLTDGKGGTNYAIEVARAMIKENPEKYVMLDQFENAANSAAHYETTGFEIMRDIPEITHFVAGMGTGGTLMGVGRRLKEYNKSIAVIGVEPKPGSTIQGLRNMTAYNPPIFKKETLDRTISIDDDEIAFSLARDLFKKEGISVGMSSGAALFGAIQVANELKSGVVVTLFPDRADKYVHTKLFE
ncbi:cysteine synthase B [Candidatus Dependentiae bacterium HGW-Dependentiae-1]|nr:MAG: cysteine synthase B [Candidatus Dependentiae bacterium HGW-Dependentiae-1]